MEPHRTDNLNPNIRAQIAEAMSRQLQMTQLSKQNSAPKVEKHSSLPFSVSATRVAFPGTSAASPTLRRMVVGNLQSSLEPRTVMPVKPARRYSLEPPKDHRLGPQTLGYADFYPQIPGQDEDVLSEAHIRQGYLDKPILQNEHQSAKDLLQEALFMDGITSRLSSVGAEVLKNRPPSIAPEAGSRRSPRLEKMDETKTEQWFRDLEDPMVSLDSLAPTIPAEMGDSDLLERLASRKVPILRANWCIKTIVSSEMPLSLIVENGEPRWASWADSLRLYLNRLLDTFVMDDLGSPPATNQKGSSKESKSARDMQMDNLRASWIVAWDKFRYVTRLVQWQCDEKLLPLSRFTQWAVQRFRKANEAETFLLLPLLSDWLVPISSSRSLIGDLVHAALQRLEWLSRDLKESDRVKDLSRQGLLRLLQCAILLEPDVLVVSRWRSTCETVIAQVFAQPPPEFLPEASREECAILLKSYEIMVSQRNSSLFRTKEVSATTLERKLTALDTPWDALSLADRFRSLFSGTANDDEETLGCICKWAITAERYGAHRPYLAAQLFRMHVASSGLGAEAAQNFLSNFLEEHDPASEEEERNILVLFGELDRCRVFSFSMFLQRLVAKGCFSRSSALRAGMLRSVKYVQSLPLVRPLPHIVNQRNAHLDRSFVEEAETIFNGLTEKYETALFSETPALLDDISEVKSLGRNLQLRLGDWIMDRARERLVLADPDEDNTDRIARTLDLLENLGDYAALIDLCYMVVARATNRLTLQLCLDCLFTRLDIIASRDFTEELFVLVLNKHAQMKQYLPSVARRLLELCTVLSKLPGYGYLSENLHSDSTSPLLSKKGAPFTGEQLQAFLTTSEEDVADYAATLVAGVDGGDLTKVVFRFATAVFADATGRPMEERNRMGQLLLELSCLGAISLADTCAAVLLPGFGLTQAESASGPNADILQLARYLLWSRMTLQDDGGSGLQISINSMHLRSLKRRRQELLNNSPGIYLEVLCSLTCLYVLPGAENAAGMASEGREALLEQAISVNAAQRGLWKLRDIVVPPFGNILAVIDQVGPLLRENAMRLLGVSSSGWDSNLFHLLEDMDEWTHQRIMRVILCRMEFEQSSSSDDLARAFVEGSVLKGRVSSRMIYRFLERLHVSHLELIMDCLLAKLTETEADGTPSFPDTKLHGESAISAFTACLLKCTQLLGKLGSEVENDQGENYPERLCLALFEQFQWFVQQDRVLTRMVLVPISARMEDSTQTTRNSLFPQPALEAQPVEPAENLGLGELCSKLQLRLDLLQGYFDVVAKKPAVCRLTDFVRLLILLLGNPLFATVLPESQKHMIWDIVCYWMENVSEDDQLACAYNIANLVKAGSLPAKSVALAEWLVSDILESDAPPDRSAIALWEPVEHTTWNGEASPLRGRSYNTFFMEGWQTPVLIQLSVATDDNDLLYILDTPGGATATGEDTFGLGVDLQDAMDLVAEDEMSEMLAPVMKKQRVQ